jgi:hypothetical protein
VFCHILSSATSLFIFRSSVADNYFNAIISVWQTYNKVLGVVFWTFVQLGHSKIKSDDISQLIFPIKFLVVNRLINIFEVLLQCTMSTWVLYIFWLMKVVQDYSTHLPITLIFERLNILAGQPIQWSVVECLLCRCDQDSSSLQVVSTCSNSLKGSYQVEPDRFDERKIRNFLHSCETEVWLTI